MSARVRFTSAKQGIADARLIYRCRWFQVWIAEEHVTSLGVQISGRTVDGDDLPPCRGTAHGQQASK